MFVLVSTHLPKLLVIIQEVSTISRTLLVIISSTLPQNPNTLSNSGILLILCNALLTLLSAITQPQPPQPQPNPTTQASSNIGPCFNCGQYGNFANKCP